MASEAFTNITESISEDPFSRTLLGVDIVSNCIKDYAVKANPEYSSDPISAIVALTKNQKEVITRKLRNYFPTSQRPTYKSRFHEFSNYEDNGSKSQCAKYLPDDRKKEVDGSLEIDLSDHGSMYIEDQYFHFESGIPEYDPTDPVIATIEDFDPENIYYSYTAKPGIRLLKNYQFQCEGAGVQCVQRPLIQLIDEEMIPVNMKPLWNNLIGHDLGDEAQQIVSDQEYCETRIMKTGYQTPKKVQEGLDLYIPLFLTYNSEKIARLNTSSFRHNSLDIKYTLERSSLMVRAEYRVGTDDPIAIRCKPLKIKNISLVSNYVEVGDVLYALNMCGGFKRYVDLPSVEKTCIRDLDESIDIQGRGSAVEAVYAYIVPKTYEEDFDLWVHHQPVQKKCISCPAIILEDDGEPTRAAVTPAVLYEPFRCVESISMDWNGTEFKRENKPEIYEKLVKYRISKDTTRYHVEFPNNGIYAFVYNDLFPTRQISGLLNMAKTNKTTFNIKFCEEFCDPNNKLHEDYYAYFIIFNINSQLSYGRTVGTGHQQ